MIKSEGRSKKAEGRAENLLLNEAKQEQKFEIASLDDIFSHAEGLREVVGRLMEA